MTAVMPEGRLEGITAAAGMPAGSPLTRVQLVRIPGETETRLRFGHPVRIVRMSQHRRVALFASNAVFCCLRRDFGSAPGRWQLLVLMSSAAQAGTQPVDGITPGVHVLAHTDGEATVSQVLNQISVIGAQGIDPADAAPAYWRTLHNRLSAGMALPEYSPDRHADYLARRVVR